MVGSTNKSFKLYYIAIDWKKRVNSIRRGFKTFVTCGDLGQHMMQLSFHFISSILNKIKAKLEVNCDGFMGITC